MWSRMSKKTLKLDLAFRNEEKTASFILFFIIVILQYYLLFEIHNTWFSRIPANLWIFEAFILIRAAWRQNSDQKWNDSLLIFVCNKICKLWFGIIFGHFWPCILWSCQALKQILSMVKYFSSNSKYVINFTFLFI